MTDICIIGAGGHGQTVLANFLAEQSAHRYLFLDEQKVGQTVCGVEVAGRFDMVPDLIHEYQFIVGVGDPCIRGHLSCEIMRMGGTLITAVHPTAAVCQDVIIGDGTFIGPQATIGAGVHIGHYCIVNNNASIGHFCVLEDGCSVNDGSHFSGGVVVGAEAYVGMGVIAFANVKIGARSIIGAGALLRYDVGPDLTVITPHPKVRILRHKGTHA